MNTRHERRIRKPVDQLTWADFAASPVWEFALDEEGEPGQDETTVRPYPVNGELDPTRGMFVIAAKFVLADGTPMQGYLTPPVQGEASLGTLQPIIITPVGQVFFWCGMIAPDDERIAQSYSMLGKSSPSEVFPIEFESNFPVRGGPIRGALPAFLVLEDWKTQRTRRVR
jgi:hypothetical protein